MTDEFSRRSMLLAGFSVFVTSRVSSGQADGPLPKVVVNKDPTCGCCQKWADYLSAAGFPVEVVATPEIAALKVRLGVPDNLMSCHTAEAAGYILEGHVPAEAVLRLLRERPAAIGLAVPGMPAGAPGMEGGTPEPYDVILFGNDVRKSYARFRGEAELPL